MLLTTGHGHAAHAEEEDQPVEDAVTLHRGERPARIATGTVTSKVSLARGWRNSPDGSSTSGAIGIWRRQESPQCPVTKEPGPNRGSG